MTKVGIQGVQASFHDVAARKYFSQINPSGEIKSVECASFKSLCEALKTKEAQFCLMAIENSIAGSILPNYSLLQSYGFKIKGEVYLRIEMSLMALPGQKISELSSVYSHPMALHQCTEFLSQYPHLQAIESNDTAESAQDISKGKIRGRACIAHENAARLFGLEILAQGIESNKQNYTRFLVLERAEDYTQDPNSNKASIRIETNHKPGALSRVLSIIEEAQLNMSLIQSVPILGRPYEYAFHIDLEWQDRQSYLNALPKLKAASLQLIEFGEYPRGEKAIL